MTRVRTDTVPDFLYIGTSKSGSTWLKYGMSFPGSSITQLSRNSCASYSY